jgi:hypothetical protein
MYSAKPKVGEKDTITIESLSTWTEVASFGYLLGRL